MIRNERRPKVLISALNMVSEQERFTQELGEFDLVYLSSGQFLAESEILDFLESHGPIDGWISGDDEITRAVLREVSPTLRVISKWGSGLDSIDLESAEEMGVNVINSPSGLATAVAEVALGYAIDIMRGLGHQNRAVRRGEWLKYQGNNLGGSTVGLIGFGRIGKRLANLLTCLGASVIFHDPKYPEESVTLEHLLPRVKVLFLCAPLVPETKGIVNRKNLSLMQSNSYVVNVSRGQLVVEKDLERAIRQGNLAGAALDVLSEEPPQANNKLLELEEVIIGCHNANNSHEAVNLVHAEAISNLRAHF